MKRKASRKRNVKHKIKTKLRLKKKTTSQPQAQVSEIKFGTDGWRAVISDTFTFKNVGIMAQAISEWVNTNLRRKAGTPKRVAVGYDTRFLSSKYAEIVSRALAANNIEVLLSDSAIPTPAL